jgi:hypothetical protein
LGFPAIKHRSNTVAGRRIGLPSPLWHHTFSHPRPKTFSLSAPRLSKMPKLTVSAGDAPEIVGASEIWTVYDGVEDLASLFRAELSNMMRACLFTLSGWYL